VTLRFLAIAQTEFDEAVNWYDSVSPHLGDAFLSEATRVFRLIEQYPVAWHPMLQNIRRCRLTRFPYDVIYVPDDKDQVIIAFAHLHRAPLYWRERLKTGDV